MLQTERDRDIALHPRIKPRRIRDNPPYLPRYVTYSALATFPRADSNRAMTKLSPSLVFATSLFAALALSALGRGPTWTADNGNGTYTNPLFYDEFSDPDVIRVGDDFYLTGTTMHTMPGLPVLHSRDLVNWEWLSYAVDTLDLGPEYRLQGGEIYGQGIWAPCFRYHDGTFYIFANVNHRHTQLFRAKDPRGPWTHTELGGSYHDLSVLFDDDGKIYVVWDYNEVKMAELKPDFSDIIPETKRVIIPKGSGMGEGSHFYKINGKYYIFSAQYDPVCYMACARADRPEGPYEVTNISAQETLGVSGGHHLQDFWAKDATTMAPFEPTHNGGLAMHQGGVVETKTGEWWALSMMDHNSIGRLVCLSPITWQEGWPFYGLPGNLTRSPATWVKPNTGAESAPRAPYARDDAFAGPRLNPVWQWNHVPDNTRWSLSEKPGVLRLHATTAPDFWTARNSLTQRAVGPESIATVTVDTSGLKPGDVAGLGLLNRPYATLAIERKGDATELVWFDQRTNATARAPLSGSTVQLRVHCNFDTEFATFSYSTDGQTFAPIGGESLMIFQLKTFQGVRFALFNYHTPDGDSGYADFRDFTVDEPRPHGLMRPIPLGKTITLKTAQREVPLVKWNGRLRAMAPNGKDVTEKSAQFKVVDRGHGRVALQAEDGGFVAVSGVGGMGDVRVIAQDPGEAASFQWQEMHGNVMLMSLVTHRYVEMTAGANGLLSAQARGAAPTSEDPAEFIWAEVR